MAFVNIMTNGVILSIFFLSGALACSGSGLLVTSPQRMDALSGSCLQIPCYFSDPVGGGTPFDSARLTFGVWLKQKSTFQGNPKNVIYNSSKTDNIYPMNITGNLAQRDCTTLFSNLITAYSDIYFFRIVNWPFMATAICDPLRIKVTDSPPSPRIEISGEQRENQAVNVTCSAPTPCPRSPPRLTWNLPSASERTQQNANRILTTQIQTILLLTYKHDGLSIKCVSTYSVNEGNDNKTSETNVHLNVSYGPKDTSASISPSNLASPGSRVNLTCSSRSNPPARSLTWFKSTKDGAVNVSEGHFYSFSVTTAGVYYCMATNDFGSQTSPEIHLNITEEPSSPQWEPILGGMLGIIVLICVVVCVWWLKSKHRALQQTQSQMSEAPITEEPDRNTEDIHYGEINLSGLEPKHACDTVGGRQEHQDTVYAHVKVSEPANTRTHTEDIYAQVKKS